jgi:hypothetical protein
MARIYKRPYVKPIPAGAKMVRHKAVPHVRYPRRNGSTVLAKVTKDGQNCLVPEERWRIEYRDSAGIIRRVLAYADIKATEQMAARLEKRAAHEIEGLADPFEEQRKRPLAEHIAEYRRELEARDNEPSYVALVVSRLTALFDGCGYRFITDLSASRVMDWLADLRRKGRTRVPLDEGKEEYTTQETAAVLGIKSASVSIRVKRYRLEVIGPPKARRLPRATVEALQDRLCRATSMQTSNYYLSHAKSFCRWLVKDRRMPDNPLTHLEGGNGQIDRRHDRRELTGEELSRLLHATRASTLSYRGLTGRDRFMLYATAAGTGFRASGLASLTPESFALEDDQPTVTLAARSAKNR